MCQLCVLQFCSGAQPFAVYLARRLADPWPIVTVYAHHLCARLLVWHSFADEATAPRPARPRRAAFFERNFERGGSQKAPRGTPRMPERTHAHPEVQNPTRTHTVPHHATRRAPHFFFFPSLRTDLKTENLKSYFPALFEHEPTHTTCDLETRETSS